MKKGTTQVLATAVAACALFMASRRAAAGPASYIGGTYLENFDTLSNVVGATTFPAPGPNDVPNNSGGTLAGWSFARFGGTNTTIDFRVDNGSSTALGHAGSHGSNGSTDRALGTVATTPSVPNNGLQIVNNTTG